MTVGTAGAEDVADGLWCRWYSMTSVLGGELGWETHVMNVPGGVVVRTVGTVGAGLCFVPSAVAVISKSFGACVGMRTVNGSVYAHVLKTEKWITYEAHEGEEYKGQTRLCSTWSAEDVVRQIAADGCLPLMSIGNGGRVEGWPGDVFSVVGRESRYTYKRFREEVEGCVRVTEGL